MKIIFILLTICIHYYSYAFSFNSLFGGSGGNHKHKKTEVVDLSEAKQDFANYCTQQPSAYGFQIHCIQTSAPKNFKFDASATISCKQHVSGLENVYPEPIDLPQAFIKQMNLCPDAKIFGPNLLHTTNITESNSTSGIQKSQTDTYYDVVCNGSQSYSIEMYQKMQANYNTTISDKIVKCEKGEDVNTYSSRYILYFEIFVGLALVSFILRFYFNYETGIKKFFAKFKRK